MTAGPDTSQRSHIAARVERATTRAVSAVFARRGWQPRVIPYTGYGTDGWVRILGRVLLAPRTVPAPGPQPADHHSAERGIDHLDARRAAPPRTPATSTRQQSARGWRRFLTTPLAAVDVCVDIQGENHQVRTDQDGYLDAMLPAQLKPGWHDVTLRTSHGPPTVSRVFVVADGESWGMVSDIDDTVLVTHLPRPLVAAWNTFVQRESARVPVAGMADLYRRLLAAHPHALVVYLSTGAWNVAPTLTGFLARHGFPEGPLLLTDWGPTNTGWFRSGREHKRTPCGGLPPSCPRCNGSWSATTDNMTRPSTRISPGKPRIAFVPSPFGNSLPHNMFCPVTSPLPTRRTVPPLRPSAPRTVGISAAS